MMTSGARQTLSSGTNATWVSARIAARPLGVGIGVTFRPIRAGAFRSVGSLIDRFRRNGLNALQTIREFDEEGEGGVGMLLSNGTNVLVCHRRLFAEDQLRFFFGSVEDYSEGIAKVSGFSWTRDPTHGFQRKADRRIKLIAVASGSVLVYELPREIEIDLIRIEQIGAHSVLATDGAKFRMDLAERA